MAENYIFRLRQILAKGSFTQEQLAQRLGVTFAALNRWLHGHAKPQPRRMAAIEALYKEIVGYPSVTPEKVQRAIRQADGLRTKGLWNTIARQESLQDELLLEHTYNSTSIEGTTFTKRQTEGVIFSKAMIPDKTLIEHLEITNHATALKALFQRKYQGLVNEEFIKELHKDLMQGIHPDAGHYSQHMRAIRGVNIALTHPKDISEEMRNLIKSWRAAPRRKTIKEIANFHADFELIHPFGDGNGRVGRLLMVVQCLQGNYPPVVIENARKTEYYDVLEYAQKKSEGPFICFLVEEMERTRQLIRKYEDK